MIDVIVDVVAFIWPCYIIFMYAQGFIFIHALLKVFEVGLFEDDAVQQAVLNLMWTIVASPNCQVSCLAAH